MTKFPWFALGTGTTRWGIVTWANIVHVDHGWKGLWHLSLAQPIVANIASWGDVVALAGDLARGAIMQMLATFPYNLGTLVLVLAWLIETRQVFGDLHDLFEVFVGGIRAMHDDELNGEN
jgi:hypothetical protein